MPTKEDSRKIELARDYLDAPALLDASEKRVLDDYLILMEDREIDTTTISDEEILDLLASVTNTLDVNGDQDADKVHELCSTVFDKYNKPHIIVAWKNYSGDLKRYVGPYKSHNEAIEAVPRVVNMGESYTCQPLIPPEEA